jgi:hypothetical protein
MPKKVTQPEQQVTNIKTCSLCGSVLTKAVKYRSFKHLNGNQTFACSKCTWEGAGTWMKAMEEIDHIYTELGKLRTIPMGDVDKLMDTWDEVHYGLFDELESYMDRLSEREYDDD